MKKLFKNVLTIALSCSILLSCTACGPIGEVIEQGDPSKTQLLVYSYDGGVGNVWLDKVIERFEKAYENYEFEPGSDKKGADIIPIKKKEEADLSTIKNSPNHVFFSEWIDVPSLYAQNLVLDVNDVVTTPLNEFLVDEKGVSVTTDTETIEDKLYPRSQDFFSHKKVNGENRYFGLPHYSHFPGFTYNKAYFDSQGLYFAAERLDVLDGQFISEDNPTKSCGPDGVVGTTDDGLPATWDEMFELFDYIVDKGDTPLIWAGKGVEGYTQYLLTSTFVNLAGITVAESNYTFTSNGAEFDVVTGFDKNDNPILGKAVIEKKQPDSAPSALNSLLSKWQAIETFDKVVDNRDYMHDDCVSLSSTMLDTQKDFIFSATDNAPVAMILEGSYWYNEAEDAGYFTQAKAKPGWASKNDYRIMPMPRVYNGTAADDVLGKNVHKSVVADGSDSFACINASIKDNENLVKLAKMFLAFCYTDESLAEFTETTNIPRFMDYDIDTSKLSNNYAKSVWDYYKASDVLLPYSSDEVYIGSKKDYSLHIESRFWECGKGAPWNNLKGVNKTAADYFKIFMNN